MFNGEEDVLFFKFKFSFILRDKLLLCLDVGVVSVREVSLRVVVKSFIFNVYLDDVWEKKDGYGDERSRYKRSFNVSYVVNLNKYRKYYFLVNVLL